MLDTAGVGTGGSDTPLHEGLAEAVQASLLPGLALLAPMFAILGVFHFFLLDPPASFAMGILALSTALAYGVALVRLTRRPLAASRAHRAAAAIAAGVLVNSCAHLVLVGDPPDTINLLLLMVGAGFVLLSRRWLAAVLVLSWGGWFLAVAMHPGQPWMRFAFALASATVLAVLVHAVRVRTLGRLEALRLGLERRVRDRTRELESSNILLRAVTDHLPDAVCIRDVDGVHRFANASARQRRGVPLVGERNAAILPADVAAREDAEDAEVLRSGTPVIERPETVISPNGTDRHIVVSKYAVRTDAGDVVGLLDVRRDVTEARRQQKGRLEMEQRLQHAQKLQSLGVLTGGIAHDFNNLLTGVLGSVSLLRLGGADPSRAEHHLATIESSAQQASDLCRQLLAYAGRAPLLIERLEMNALVRAALPLIRLSASRDIELQLALTPDPLLIDGDPSQITQVVMNLVLNAAEALTGRHDGVITVASGRIRIDGHAGAAPGTGIELAPGTYAFLEVVDNGGGMSAETRARIFEPFFTTKFTGRGLGLAVVVGIARSHGGTVEVASEPDGGASFTVLFPLAADDTMPAPVAPPPPPRTVVLEGDALLIDDEPIVREVVGEMLERIGLRPVVADDGISGLELFSASPDQYRVVIVDLTMPGAGGREVLRDVRAVRPDCPVLLISGFSDAEIVLDDAARASTAFLQKPFSIEALQATLDQLITGQRQP